MVFMKEMKKFFFFAFVFCVTWVSVGHKHVNLVDRQKDCTALANIWYHQAVQAEWVFGITTLTYLIPGYSNT
ncbi:hypothetical protein B0J17DRAFT_96386 [Rhizoctonia solani]|nr:hypothetical protein B0J17DRAFT_96386 [Rhizoctonia solani]